MKLCCVQLFNAGVLDHVPRIWQAKESSWEAPCSIDVHCCAVPAFEQTKAYLAADGSEPAAAMLHYCSRVRRPATSPASQSKSSPVGIPGT
jgi:hypothetical protein